jgi:hypothetical protein
MSLSYKLDPNNLAIIQIVKDKTVKANLATCKNAKIKIKRSVKVRIGEFAMQSLFGSENI